MLSGVLVAALGSPVFVNVVWLLVNEIHPFVQARN
jgi:hypothetical protein